MRRRVLRLVCFCLVFCTLLGNNFTLISSAKTVDADISVPGISAQSAILIEVQNGNIVYEKNAHIRLPMASTTKIMTAIVAMEYADPAMMVEIPPAAVGVEGSSIYLYAGECLSLENLLYALLLESANDAAVAIAIAVAGSVDAFAELMNLKAAALGLTDTHFTNPHGLDHEQHYTTASDLAKIAAYCMQNELFRTIVATQRMTIPLHDTEGVRLLLNHNRLLRTYQGTIGLKTGFTKRSGRCLVSAAERDGVTLIAVTLNAPDDWDDHSHMFDYGFDRFESQLLQTANGYTHTLPVIGGVQTSVTVSNTNEVRVVLPRNHGEITFTCELPRWTVGGIVQGQELGHLVWRCDGEMIASVPLVAQTSVPAISQRMTLWERFLALFSYF